MARYLTLSPENQFRFVCPIFDTEVKFSQCMQVRDAVYSGKNLPVRKGCQACMHSSKCPVFEIVRSIAPERNTPDDYGSTTPVVGKIRKDVLEKIAPIMVLPRTMENLGVSPAEQAMIESSSERIRKLAGMAPGPSAENSSSRASSKPSRKPATKKVAPQNDNKINEAAATGDLAAAVSQ